MDNFDRPHVLKIVVKQLFGNYDYSLEACTTKSSDDSMLLYGNNGTGKSTILKMTSYLLSDCQDYSILGKLLNIEFETFEITLSNGVVVGAYRTESSNRYIGSYTYRYTLDQEIVIQLPITGKLSARNDEYVNSTFDCESAKDYIHELDKRIDVNMLFISDSRKEFGSRDTDDEMDAMRRRRELRRDLRNTEDIDLEISEFNSWVLTSVFDATKKGEEGAYSIYTKILNQLKRKPKNAKTFSFDEIVERLKLIDEKTKKYEEIGFISASDYESIVDKLLKVPRIRRESSLSILQPFIESQEAKLTSLDMLFNLISYLVQSLDQYLYNKRVRYSLYDGLQIIQSNHIEPLKLSNLSSGEKNLLMLLSKIIRHSTSCSIIIIDEPEISLNIKWQRTLIKTLRMLTEGQNVQFIIATHSFEILSGMSKNVVKLEDNKEYCNV